MNTAESNSSRKEQEEQARQSPMKRPETETAHAQPEDIGHATRDDTGRSPAIDPPPYGRETAHPRNRAQLPEDVHPRGIDADNDDASDDTVDTDGKDRDAKRVGRMEDSEVVSNASPDNTGETPATGLAGIDSRPGGSRPAILSESGAAPTYQGVAEAPDTGLYGAAGAPPATEEADATARFAEHVPPNHARIGQTVRITPDKPQD